VEEPKEEQVEGLGDGSHGLVCRALKAADVIMLSVQTHIRIVKNVFIIVLRCVGVYLITTLVD